MNGSVLDCMSWGQITVHDTLLALGFVKLNDWMDHESGILNINTGVETKEKTTNDMATACYRVCLTQRGQYMSGSSISLPNHNFYGRRRAGN